MGHYDAQRDLDDEIYFKSPEYKRRQAEIAAKLSAEKEKRFEEFLEFLSRAQKLNRV